MCTSRVDTLLPDVGTLFWLHRAQLRFYAGDCYQRLLALREGCRIMLRSAYFLGCV